MRIRIHNPAMYSEVLTTSSAGRICQMPTRTPGLDSRKKFCEPGRPSPYLPPAWQGESARCLPAPRAQTPGRSSASQANPHPTYRHLGRENLPDAYPHPELRLREEVPRAGQTLTLFTSSSAGRICQMPSRTQSSDFGKKFREPGKPSPYLPRAQQGESARRLPAPRAQTPGRSSVSRADSHPTYGELGRENLPNTYPHPELRLREEVPGARQTLTLLTASSAGRICQTPTRTPGSDSRKKFREPGRPSPSGSLKSTFLGHLNINLFYPGN
jgi:hypothetical protein